MGEEEIGVGTCQSGDVEEGEFGSNFGREGFLVGSEEGKEIEEGGRHEGQKKRTAELAKILSPSGLTFSSVLQLWAIPLSLRLSEHSEARHEVQEAKR